MFLAVSGYHALKTMLLIHLSAFTTQVDTNTIAEAVVESQRWGRHVSLNNVQQYNLDYLELR